MQKIMPHLWFDTQAMDAAEFYTTVFPHSSITSTATLHDTPGGDCDVVSFNLNSHDFMAISGGPMFTINPSISFMVNFDPGSDGRARQHLDALWEKLADGGATLMPLGEYPFSKRYGWVQDRFGVTWQLILTDPAGEPRPFILPSLMFTGEQTNRAEEAIDFYRRTFDNSALGTVARHTQHTGPAAEGSLMFADFMLENQWFTAMDSGAEHQFGFNEAVSLLVNCDTQQEIDYYWEKLAADPESGQCGWVKDRFGVSWQISPTVLNDMLANGTREQVDRITQAFMPMKKLDIAVIEAAYAGGSPAHRTSR
ncbi:MAG: VOC family protein [Mycolicibacterium sp.]|uniref:VOC family protein n=1 Tax=Mycolicibacterium sp. TaxID=2320850 RepID=UPI003D0DDCDC